MEGIIDQKEKVKIAASKGKECFQYYMGYLKGTYLTDNALSRRTVLGHPAKSRELDMMILMHPF